MKLTLFSKRLKELRTSANLTQEELGKNLSVTKSAICGYEKGNRTAPMEMLIAIANYFKVDLDYLVGTENYVVSDDKEDYGMRMSSLEIELIKELRKHTDLYNKMMEDSKRTIEYMEKKIR